jgi:isoleucyl-tRNA synthetase
MEEGILKFWEERGIFAKSLEARKGAREYVFFDGPPFATGLPHYGHLLAGTIKDIVPRYRTMRGDHVARRFGWDCHGLPIEALAQDKLGLKGTPDILAAGVDTFNETCRSMVLRYVSEWRKIVTRMGRWVDFDNDYKTMDRGYMETIWWVFKQLWEQGRVYKSHRIMPYSWKMGTPLSNFEAGSNYQDVQDPAITVRVKLRDLPPGLSAPESGAWALVWTTTPWTLFGNLAVCAGADIDYVAAKDKADGTVYVLAEARLGAYWKDEAGREIVGRWKGSELKGLRYEPIFGTFVGEPGTEETCWRVLNGDFVTTEDGTGLVHMAPAFGEDDYKACTAAGIPLLDYLDGECAFTERVPEYKGQFCKDADKAIIRRLKESGQLVHQGTIVHSYPFCPRTDTPLIYRAIEAWYVRVEDLHDRLAANNETVRWVPDAVGTKRFANWLRDAKDWNISRNRFWGSCIPVWINEDDPSDMICVGSVAELEALSGEKIEDLHKHHVDQVVIRRDGKTYRRTPEVLDCWFESGSMPYAQQHYPFERADELERFFPADFIAEGLDQTRGWFYTLMVLGTALFGKSPYKNVIVNGLVLAEDGRKMSKRLKNYPDPMHILDTYGADALRLYMIHSPIVRAEDLCFSESGVVHALRHLLIPWWNAYSFFVTYANVDGWTPGKGAAAADSANLLDRWMLSRTDRLAGDVAAAMDAYDLQGAVRPLVGYIEDLTNWYIRRSRRRFWKSGDDADKAAAYATLHEALLRLCRVAAPFTPFVAEEIYRNLRTDGMPESVHLCDFPMPGELPRDEALEARMARTMALVGLGRSVRKDKQLNVRQPLARGAAFVMSGGRLEALPEELQRLVKEELNLKAIEFPEDPARWLEVSLKPNFPALGPRFGKKLGLVAKALAAVPSEEILAALFSDKATIDVAVNGETIALDKKADVQVKLSPKPGLAVASDGEMVLALDTELTPELIQEGLARELVNRIQNLRKEMNLEVSDRIQLTIAADGPLAAAAEAHRQPISDETLAVELRVVALAAAPEGASETEISGTPCRLSLSKA